MGHGNWLYNFYRTLLLSFSPDNTIHQNLLLLSEINDTNPKLIQEAYELLAKPKAILRYQLILRDLPPPENSTQSQTFYLIDHNDRKYLTLNGYCNCFKYRDNVLVKEREFTCVHEIVCILMSYIDPKLDSNISRILENTSYLSETDFINKMQSAFYF